MRFKDMSVLITGGGAGIGRAVCVAFAKEGAKVAINCLTAKNGESTLAEVRAYCPDAIFAQGDVSKPEDAKRIVAETVEAFGKIDILINNAGVVLGGRADDTTLADWEKTLAVNVTGVFLMSQSALSYMLPAHSGVIVNTASVCGYKGLKNRFAYGASKSAVQGMTKSMAADYALEGVRCNCVCPGTVLTPSLNDRINNAPDPEQARRDFMARQPIGRLGTPEEIAETIMFAADPKASFMNGSIIYIDGGMTV